MRTVFLDIDTQLDFVNPSGALYVPGAENIAGAVAPLNQFALEAGYTLISTTDFHAEDDPEFHEWPPHCIAGTLGQRKPSATLVGTQVTVPSTPGENGFPAGKQIILQKQEIDCFANPNLDPFLKSVAPQRIVVYGVVTEVCVECAAMGSLKLAPRVELVTDAIQSLDPAASQRFVDAFTAAGGVLTSCADVLHPAN